MRIDKYYEDKPQETKEQNTTQDVETNRRSGGIKVGSSLDKIYKHKLFLPIIVIILLILAIILRAGLLKYQGLFEPDGFFYFSVIREMVGNHMLFGPHTLNISGFPKHNPIGESPGLMTVAVLPYYLFSFAGVSYYSVMRWMPIIFGMIEAIVAYFIAKHLSNSKALGLLSMAFIVLSSGNIARTAGTVFRGDSFISLFIMVALLFMLRAYSSKNKKWVYINSVIAAVALSLGFVVWNGSPFIIAIYLLALVLLFLYSFITLDQKLAFTTMVLSIFTIITYGLDYIYIHLHMTNPGLVLAAGPSGFTYLTLFYTPVIIASIVGWYLIKKSITNVPILNTGAKRLAICILILFIYAILLLVVSKNTVAGITNQVGVVIPVKTNSTYVPIGQTTQELQPPSYNFLYSSFNLQLTFGAFFGYILNPYVANSVVVLITLLFAWIGILLFTQIGGKLANPNHSTSTFRVKGVNVTLNAAILVLFAYAFVTTYLQLSAIRFNALISIPLAILAAYTIYSISMLVYEKRASGAKAMSIGVVTLALSILLMYMLHTIPFSQFTAVTVAGVFIYVVLVALLIYSIYALITRKLEFKYVVVALVLVILAYNFYNTYYESYTAVQADGINPQFLQAMTWMKNNTPSNTTVLALWPDGSVVEGWGNRTSWMDSVGGENGTRIYNFSKWLFNTTPDTAYLYKIHKPEYLVARNFWYAELGGIAQEGLVSNATAYGYITLTSLNTTSNGTANFFIFSSDTPPYYQAELVSVPQTSNNGTIGTYRAYLGVRNSSRFALMRSIIFMNSSNSAYNIDIIGNESNSANYTLMVSFSGHVINGAYILGPKLVQSNLFKFTFLCNNVVCPYNASNVTMNVVYQNGDTRILKINYLN